MKASSASLIEALRDVTDPEIPISIVDLGLVVAADVENGRAAITITLTSMGCPALEMIVDDIRERLLQEPGIEQVDTEIVWDPIWTKARLSDDGRMQLREWGISV